jgi:hypothetical protein
VKVQHVSLLEQRRELRESGKDGAKPEIRPVEVTTDLFEPLAEANRGWAQAATTTTQRREDHEGVAQVREHFANQGIGDGLHQLAVPFHHGSVVRLFELLAPLQYVRQALHLTRILWLEQAQAILEPFRANGEPTDVETGRQGRQTILRRGG